jgi:hypothetical protein
MSDIFISYSHRDAERVEKLIGLLRARGWSVWYDNRIKVGTEFDEEIEKALSDARCAVVIWSEAACRSAWVRAEAEMALEAHKYLPVCIDPGVQLPIRFRQIQTAMLFDLEQDTDALKRFLAELADFIYPTSASSKDQASAFQTGKLRIVPGKWRIETRLIGGLLKAHYNLDLKPNGDVFGSGKVGIFGGDASGRWRFDESNARLWLNMTGSVGTEVWTLDLTEAVQGGFRAIDSHRRKNTIKRVS